MAVQASIQSSDSHTTATSTSSSANYGKTNTNNKFSHEKLKNVDNFRNDSSNMNMHIGNNRMLPFSCHFCKLAFGNNFKRTKHEQAWHSISSSAKNRKITINKS